MFTVLDIDRILLALTITVTILMYMHSIYRDENMPDCIFIRITCYNANPVCPHTRSESLVAISERDIERDMYINLQKRIIHQILDFERDFSICAHSTVHCANHINSTREQLKWPFYFLSVKRRKVNNNIVKVAR